MKNNMKNNIIFSLVFLSSVLLTVLLFNFNQRSELEREALANKKYTDSIQNQFLAKNKELANMLKLLQKQKETTHHAVNSVERIDGVSINNKPITLEQLIGIANNYMRENASLRNKIKNDSLSIERYKIIIAHLEKAKVIEQDGKGNISYPNMTSIDSNLNLLQAENKKMKHEVAAKNSLLKLIKENYGIDTKIEDKKDSYTVSLLNTSKLDSALWIFPYYKQKIKTNKKGETFIRY